MVEAVRSPPGRVDFQAKFVYVSLVSIHSTSARHLGFKDIYAEHKVSWFKRSAGDDDDEGVGAQWTTSTQTLRSM